MTTFAAAAPRNYWDAKELPDLAALERDLECARVRFVRESFDLRVENRDAGNAQRLNEMLDLLLALSAKDHGRETVGLEFIPEVPYRTSVRLFSLLVGRDPVLGFCRGDPHHDVVAFRHLAGPARIPLPLPCCFTLSTSP